MKAKALMKGYLQRYLTYIDAPIHLLEQTVRHSLQVPGPISQNGDIYSNQGMYFFSIGPVEATLATR